MKKINVVLFAIICVIGFTDTASAQLKAGGAVIYGGDIEQIGFRVEGLFKINDTYRAQADFSYFLPKDIGPTEFNWWEINANIQYSISSIEQLPVYAFAGLNFVNIESSRTGFVSRTENEVGLNVGAGAETDLGFATLFGEIKYVIGNADQLGVAGGLRFPIGN